jgi:hypothetical protein
MKPFSLVRCINADLLMYPPNNDYDSTFLKQGHVYVIHRVRIVNGEEQVVLSNDYGYFASRFKELPIIEFLNRRLL